MLTVDSPQQVMLEVKVAEVDKTLINQLGSALNIQGGFGSWTGALVSSLLAGVSSGIAVNKNNKLPFQVAVDAQKTDNLVKILAEPNLVTISGQEATFLAGGEVFIPVPQSSSTGATSIVLQQEDFGVGLKFTPTVMSNGRINLRVAPEVSELSPTGVTLTATNVSGATILPLITTRRASTTVQMSDGETFAIGGLISNNISGALKALPGIGEVPVLGALFRSTSFQQDRTELVFIITPHLVRPQRTANVPLPTDSFTQPKDVDVYATGNMEGRAAAHTDGTPAAGSAPVPAPAPAAAPTNVTPAAPAPQTPVSTTEAAPPVPAAPQAPTVATPAAATQPAHAPADPPPGSSAATVVPDKHVVAQTALAVPQDLANAGSSNAALAH
jgi:pilus assembly protein CpaC